MGKVTVVGDEITLQQIVDDDPLRGQLEALHFGDTVVLEIGGFVGRWRRTADAIAPLDLNIHQAWAAMRTEPARSVDIRLVTTDGSHLVTFGVRGQLWDDPASQYR